MADIKVGTGVDLRGLRTGLATARAEINTFKSGAGSLTLNLILNYRGPTVAQLSAITAALHAMAAAAGSVHPVNLGTGGFMANAIPAAAIASVGAAAAGLYEAAKAADAARVSHELFEKQLMRNNISLEEGARVSGELAAALNVSQQEAEEAMGDYLKQGASLEQITLYAKAGAASALNMGRSAADGMAAIAKTLSTGQSDLLDGIGISENFSKSLEKVAKSTGKAVDELNNLEKNKAMEDLLNTAVVASGEMEGLAAMTGGLAGQAGKLKSAWGDFVKALGEPFVDDFTKSLNIAATVLIKFTQMLPEIIRWVKVFAAPLAILVGGMVAYANHTAIATAATGLFAAAQLKATAALAAASTALAATSVAIPWLAAAAAIGVVINLATKYWDKMAEEAEKANEAFDKRIEEAVQGTEGSQFDGLARRYTMAVMGTENALAAAKQRLIELQEQQKRGLVSEAEVKKSEAAVERFTKKLADLNVELENIKKRAHDAEALPDFDKQLKSLQDGLRNDSMDGLAKSLDSIRTKYNGLRKTVEETFQTQEVRAKKLRDVENLRAQAIAQAKAALGNDLTKALADQQRAAEKARVDMMADGLKKRNAQRDAEIAAVEKKGQEELKKYAGLKREPEIEEATRKAVKAVRDKWDQDDQEWTRRQEIEARKRSEAIRLAELEGYRDTAEAKVKAAEYQYGRELKAAEGNAAKVLAVETSNAQKIAQAKTDAINKSFAEQSQKLRNDLNEKLDDQTMSPSDRSAWIRQYQTDVRNLTTTTKTDLASVQSEAVDKISAAVKAAQEAAAATREAQMATTRAAADYGVQTAQSAGEAVAAHQRVIEVLKQELEQRQRILAESGGKSGEQQEKAKQDVIAAQLALLQGQRDLRGEIVKQAEREFDLAKSQLDLFSQLTVSVKAREDAAATMRATLADQADYYAAQARSAAAQGASLEEINGLLDKRVAAQNEITRSMEESRKTAIAEGRAILDSQLNSARAAVQDAQNLQQRTAARQQLAQQLQLEQGLNDGLIDTYVAQGRSQAEINPLLERRRSIVSEILQLNKDQKADLDAEQEAQKKLLETQRSLNDAVRDFNNQMRDSVDIAFAEEFTRTVQDAKDALDRAADSGTNLTRVLRETAQGGNVAEGSVSQVTDAMQRAASDTSKAAEAVAKLKSMYDALKSSADQLAGSLSDLAGKTGNQQALDQLEERAKSNQLSAQENLKSVIAEYGADSKEAADAMKAVVDANKAYSDAISAGIENQVKTLEEEKAAIDRAFRGLSDTAGRDASVKAVDDKIAELRKIGEDRVKSAAQDVERSLSGAMTTVNALDRAAQKALSQSRQFAGEVQKVAQQKVDIALKIVPESVTPIGNLIGDAFIRRVNPAIQQILSLEKRAITNPASSGVTYSGNVTYNINVAGMTPNAKQLAQQLCAEISAGQRAKAATRG